MKEIVLLTAFFSSFFSFFVPCCCPPPPPPPPNQPTNLPLSLKKTMVTWHNISATDVWQLVQFLHTYQGNFLSLFLHDFVSVLFSCLDCVVFCCWHFTVQPKRLPCDYTATKSWNHTDLCRTVHGCWWVPSCVLLRGLWVQWPPSRHWWRSLPRSQRPPLVHWLCSPAKHWWGDNRLDTGWESAWQECVDTSLGALNKWMAQMAW